MTGRPLDQLDPVAVGVGEPPEDPGPSGPPGACGRRFSFPASASAGIVAASSPRGLNHEMAEPGPDLHRPAQPAGGPAPGSPPPRAGTSSMVRVAPSPMSTQPQFGVPERPRRTPREAPRSVTRYATCSVSTDPPLVRALAELPDQADVVADRVVFDGAATVVEAVEVALTPLHLPARRPTPRSVPACVPDIVPTQMTVRRRWRGARCRSARRGTPPTGVRPPGGGPRVRAACPAARCGSRSPAR